MGFARLLSRLSYLKNKGIITEKTAYKILVSACAFLVLFAGATTLKTEITKYEKNKIAATSESKELCTIITDDTYTIVEDYIKKVRQTDSEEYNKLLEYVNKHNDIEDEVTNLKFIRTSNNRMFYDLYFRMSNGSNDLGKIRIAFYLVIPYDEVREVRFKILNEEDDVTSFMQSF